MDAQEVQKALERRRARSLAVTRLQRIIEQGLVSSFAKDNYTTDMVAEVVERMPSDDIAKFMLKLGEALEDEMRDVYDRGYSDGLDDCAD